MIGHVGCPGEVGGVLLTIQRQCPVLQTSEAFSLKGLCSAGLVDYIHRCKVRVSLTGYRSRCTVGHDHDTLWSSGHGSHPQCCLLLDRQSHRWDIPWG